MCMGHFSAASAQLVPGLEDAWNRHDMCTVPMWAGRISTISGIAACDVVAAEENLRLAKAALTAPHATFQNWELWHAQVLLHSYHGRRRDAWEHAQAWFACLSRSPLGQSRWFVPDAQLVCGLTAAALAQQLAPGSERAALERVVKQARRDSGLLLVRCALECLQGDRTAAIATLRQVQSERSESGSATGHWYPMQAYAARRKLGELQQNAQGQALIQEADAFFTAGGARDPKRLASVLLPGLEIANS
jgi:hypothetical protein